MAGAAGEAPPLLCRGGCGFYGSAANDGMCSRCASGNVITAQPQPQPTTAGTAAAGSDDAAVRRLGGFGDRQLRAVIVSAGLSHDDCTSLEQLRERARQAMTSSTTGSTAAGGGGSTHGGGVQMMEVQRRELAGLACTLVGSRGCLRGAATIELAVLIMHGFSASAADLVPICESIGANTGALQGRRVVFVLPQAPGQPSAWWTIDVMQWAMALMGGGGIEQLTRMRHPGLDHARTRGLTLLAAIQQLGCAAGAGTPLPMARVVIGGFSQGAMTAVDLALQLPPDGQCGGVMALSQPFVPLYWPY
jgi:pimeloyl-ACP methyl ester carboxylesterase